MVNDLIDGIANKLFSVFGAEYSIYTEHVIQGWKEPCFFIDCISSSRKQIVGGRYESKNRFDVRYHCPNTNVKEECEKMADLLYGILRLVPMKDGLIRGTEMHAEMVDEVLHFMVSYNTFLWEQPEKNPYMRHLKVDGEVK